jgi:hypothetical protein
VSLFFSSTKTLVHMGLVALVELMFTGHFLVHMGLI